LLAKNKSNSRSIHKTRLIIDTFNKAKVIIDYFNKYKPQTKT